MPTRVKLNDGNEMPTMAFGTGSVMKEKEDVVGFVEQALDSGFDHIDTSPIYYNEDKVGTALHESGLSRKELYITTKYDWGPIQKAVRDSLDKLGLKSVDLYLIHGPNLIEKDVEGSWKELEKIKEDGLAKSIGVSNFNVEQLQKVIKTARIKPAVNQINFNPYNYASQKAVVEYAAKHGIVTAGYSGLTPLSRSPGGPVDPVVSTIAARLNVSAAQVLLKWVRSKGVAVVTTSSKKERLAEYLAVEELPDLTAAEIAAIDAAGAKGPPSTASAVVHFLRRPFTLGNLWPSQEAIHENIYRVSATYGVCAAVLLIVFMYCLRHGWTY